MSEFEDKLRRLKAGERIVLPSDEKRAAEEQAREARRAQGAQKEEERRIQTEGEKRSLEEASERQLAVIRPLLQQVGVMRMLEEVKRLDVLELDSSRYSKGERRVIKREGQRVTGPFIEEASYLTSRELLDTWRQPSLRYSARLPVAKTTVFLKAPILSSINEYEPGSSDAAEGGVGGGGYRTIGHKMGWSRYGVEAETTWPKFPNEPFDEKEVQLDCHFIYSGSQKHLGEFNLPVFNLPHDYAHTLKKSIEDFIVEDVARRTSTFRI